MKSKKIEEMGQALVIVLMVIALTATLAGTAAFRTVNQTRQTNEAEEKQKTSNIAKGIIEKALNNETVDTTNDFGDSTNINQGVAPLQTRTQNTAEFVTPLIAKDSQFIFYLQPYKFDGNAFSGTPAPKSFQIYFDGGTCPVIEVTYINTSNSVTKKELSADCPPNTVSGGANRLNYVNAAKSFNVNNVPFTLKKYVSLSTTTAHRMVIVRPLFADTRLAFVGANLPPQGETVTGSAQGAAGAQSSETVFRPYPQIPDFFFATSF